MVPSDRPAVRGIIRGRCSMDSMSLYDHPGVYAALLRPEPDLLAAMESWRGDWLTGPFDSLMDPCCGPGTWLLPFSGRGLALAGNDLSPRMIEEAGRSIRGSGTEWTVGDMRRLDFRSGPFDVAMNMHASVGHLPGLDAVREHLGSVRRSLRRDGLYFLGVVVNDDSTVDRTPKVLFESPPTELAGGGMAAVRYESLERNGRSQSETIQLHLLTCGVDGCPPVLSERYALKSYRSKPLMRVIEDSGFEILAAHDMEADGYPDVGLTRNCGDVTLILAAL